MADIKEEFTKVNDCTLRHDQEEERSYARTRLRVHHSRLFNFLARQVETVHSEHLYDYSHDVPVALAVQTRVENFDEMPSTLEIKFMHAKLTEMGGKPPALEDILPNEMHKPVQGRKTLGGER